VDDQTIPAVVTRLLEAVGIDRAEAASLADSAGRKHRANTPEPT
jgi:hypothetical protein